MEKNAIKQIAKRIDSVQLIQDMFELNSYTKAEQMEAIEKYKKHMSDKDYEYLKCVLFPELTDPVRVPTPFGIPSAVFTQKISFYLSTGLSGNGYIQFAPKDTSFYCCAATASDTAYNGNPNNAAIPLEYFTVSDGTFITFNFAQSRLIGASMRCSYIGTVD